MPTLNKKDRDIIDLAMKGGNDSALMLLEQIHKLEDFFHENRERIEKLEELFHDIKKDLIPRLKENGLLKTALNNSVHEEDIERMVAKLALKLVEIKKGDKGEPGRTPTKTELLDLIFPLIPESIPGDEGHTPTKEELLVLIEPLIPMIPTNEIIAQIVQDLPKYGTAFRDGLELLQGEERLSTDAIKGLEELLKKQNKLFGNKVIMTGQNPGSMIKLTATGTVDNSNTVFTFAQKPLFIVVNGQILDEDNGWSWSGATTATLDNPVGSSGRIYGLL